MISSDSLDDKAPSVEKDLEARQEDDGSIDEAMEPASPVQSHRSSSLRKSHSALRNNNIVVEIFPESDLDKGIVGWEGQDDPLNPKNFPESRKWLYLGCVSAVAFLSPLSSSITAPGIPLMDVEFKNTSTILDSLAVSIFVLGFAIGPLILSPLSEIYGRRPVLNAANLLLTLWAIGCAKAPNLAVLIVSRLFSGVGGSACLTIGGGVMSDLFPVQQRGKANALFSLGPLFGPVVGPIIGGFIAERTSWRWVFWVLLIACGVFTIANLIINRETNPVVLIRHKTERLRKELGREDLQSAYDVSKAASELRKRSILARGLVRPLRMLFTSPTLTLLSIYMSFVFGLLFLLFTTITSVFIKSYGFSPELCGLAYIGTGIGFLLGVIVVGKTSDPTIIRLTRANNGVYEPEMRLASCLVFAFFIPISFFWYGWSADKKTHWIVPIIGLTPFGFGMMGVFAPIQTYFIDVSGQYAASAIAGLTACRCLFAAFLPLAGPKMYDALGLGWGNSLLGFLALALIPAPGLIFRYGGALRKKYPIQLGT